MWNAKPLYMLAASQLAHARAGRVNASHERSTPQVSAQRARAAPLRHRSSRERAATRNACAAGEATRRTQRGASKRGEAGAFGTRHAPGARDGAKAEAGNYGAVRYVEHGLNASHGASNACNAR